jgi:hypothetical protein
MYDLFQEAPTQQGGLVFPEMRMIREGVRQTITKVQQYRLANPMSLTGTHPLIRLLLSVNIPLSLPTEVYYDRVTETTYNLARNLQFTSPVSRGKLHSPSMFYGDNVSDIVLVHDEVFDLNGIESRWKDLQPIRVLYHPQTDLGFNVPDGRFSSVESGIAVISINLPMLAVQYRQWRQWERGVVAAESPRTVMMFLQAHALPNMLDSHVDGVLFNRLFAQYFGVDMPEVKSHNPFFIYDWRPKIDAVLSKYLDAAAARRMDFDTMIDTMPTIGYTSRYETLRWPQMPFTYQVTWALVLARLANVMFLTRFAADNQIHRNRSTLNDLNRFFSKVRQLKALEQSLPPDELGVVNQIIDTGIIPYLTTT